MSKAKRKPGWKTLTMAAILTEPGSSMWYKTGDWRAFRPVVDIEKCTGCLLCWIYCPEPAIVQKDKKVRVDYDFCKGCGICAEECPVKAITMIEEGAK